MSRLAVIATIYRRPWALPRIAYALAEQTRKVDHLVIACDNMADFRAALDAGLVSGRICDRVLVDRVVAHEGQNPLGVELNRSLDTLPGDVDYVTYLTDDSIPSPDKYRLMAQALDENPDWFAVYCSQDYGRASGPEDWVAGGTHQGVRHATDPEPNPFCRVDHTQVMHRRTDVRWPESYDDRKLSDAHFFRALVEKHGPLMPVPHVLDWTRQLPDGLSQR